MIFKPEKIIPQKVTVNVEESINTFLCTGCYKEIAASKKFIIDCSKYRELNIIQNSGKNYLRCECGIFYEIIKCQSKEFEDGLKFKEVIIVEID